MQTYKDGQGKARKFELTIYGCDQVLDLCGIDLLKIIDEDLAAPPGTVLHTLQTDRRLLCQILHVLMDDSVPDGVEFDEFRKAMTGDGLAAATDALLREIFRFFPRHRRDAVLRLYETDQQLQQAIQDSTALTDQLIMTPLTEIVRSVGASLSGAGPASSSLIPAGSPSDNSATCATLTALNAGITPAQ